MVVELCRQLSVRQLDLIGSAAKGSFDPTRSDLDFLVSFQSEEPASYTRNYFRLASELERLFGRKVDLVTERMVRNPYFRESIARSRVAVYAA